VDASYAIPSEFLEIDNVITFLFRGLCRSEDEYEMAFQEFREREQEIFSTVRSVPRMDEREIEKTVPYFKQFSLRSMIRKRSGLNFIGPAGPIRTAFS
jgi:hypothetical protein